MDKLEAFLDEKLGPVMSVIGTNRYLLAVRDGVISALPLIIVGSLFLILASPPLPQEWVITQVLTANSTKILMVYRMTMSIMTLYAVFGMGNSLAKSFKLDGLTGGILSAMALLLTITPVNIPADLDAGVSGYVLPLSTLGGGGLFVGILMSFLAVTVYRLTQRSRFKLTMPQQVPPGVARSFEALTPTLVIMVVVGGITYWAGFDWYGTILAAVSPLVTATDTLPGVLLLVFLTTFFWFFGIHGASIVGSIARPVWLMLLDENTAALAAGTAATQLPATSAEPFYQWFVWIGGSGCAIGLAICLVTVCRSHYMRSLGRIGFAPALFNINEPLVFGTPIVLNPIVAVPFVVTPMICATIAWLVTAAGLVNHVSVIAPWTLPGPIGAYVSCGGDWRAAVLCVILIGVSVLCYLPFVKVYDRRLLAQEQADQDDAGSQDGATPTPAEKDAGLADA
ncbi:MAG: PTS sugar transporter subunit IIC [Atopobiaceae bacterium]|jgi:PTS system cellobiose-specific IIC component|nr:PTS sugar transporter subunit IIC [Atopobiaceae bacterium]MCH4181335.1 PTS sugar transporter subunit IIC [Atopobiaceae bacterium]MCH4213510.1 PTS sugar transporter subunit IIC [Atopobiaceae bacterium]MCH4229732.1 PTS sugar transporter subunit IIC [Atopobiaceae bacterium]MCH4276157.1 PTS sugar transporter subunit IIC [Atopobiaceae bacterium]